MIEYQIKIPIPTVLKKNSKAIYSLNVHLGTHYRTYSAVKNKYKAIYLTELEKHDKVLLESLELTYEIHLRNKRLVDMDNVVFTQKFLQDTMVENGYIVDDSCNILYRNVIKYGGVDKEAEYSYVLVNIRGKEHVQLGSKFI